MPVASYQKIENFSLLHQRGAHLVAVKGGTGPDRKQAIESEWQHRPMTMDALVLLVASGGLIGLIPASIRASVLDLDKKGDTDGVSLFPYLPSPHSWAFSISGIGLHLWYDTIPGLTRRALPGVGDVIGDRQYVILTEDGANAALVAAESISNRQLPFPSELFGLPSFPPANNAPQTGRDVGEWAWWRFPHPVVAYEGQRHTVLFKLLLTALSWNRKYRGNAQAALSLAAMYNARFQPALPWVEVLSIAGAAAGYSQTWNDEGEFRERQRVRGQRGARARWDRLRATPPYPLGTPTYSIRL